MGSRISVGRRADVRFSDPQYRRLIAEARILGISVPTLLRNSYFRKMPVKILMDHADRNTIFTQLARIGNNVNQIARKVNTGFHEGWHKEFSEAVQVLINLERYLVGEYGLR